jgi:translocation and assembly module TamB
VQELHARAGDGAVEGSGQLDVAPGGPLPLGLTLRFDHFLALRRETVEAAASGTLTARGSLTAPEVSGVLDLEHALIRPAGLPSQPPTLAADPTIAVVGLEEPPAPAAPEPGPGLPAPLALGVTIRIAHDASIRRSDANIALGGEVVLAKAAREPAHLTGQVRLLHGWFEFQGRRFDIKEGTIALGGGTPPEPIFDVTAGYRTSTYRITVHITGPPNKPNLTFTSDPPLEQADILSVILFGKPARELGHGQSLALQQQALQIATGYVVPQLRESVLNALGLDTLEVAFPDQPQAPGQVRVGRYVSQDVILSLGQEFGSRVAQVVGIEYSVGTNVSVRASTSTRGDSAVDLIWQRRY